MTLKMHSALFLLISIFTFNFHAVVTETLDSEKELRLIHVIFRHGVRTPSLVYGTYPKDVYFNHTYYPYGIGQLTNEGKIAQYKLGQYLRKRYNTFLGDLYQSGVVLAQSSDLARTFMSCSLALAGMWPTKGTALEWNPNFNWSPIPIKIQPIHEDTLLLATKKCPRYAKEFHRMLIHPEVADKMASNVELIDKFSEITGAKMYSFFDIAYYYNIIWSQAYLNLDLPENIKSIYHEITPLAEFNLKIGIYNNVLRRFKMGNLLKQMIDHWTAKSNNTLIPLNRKIFVYSAHDVTIASFLSALGAWNLRYPMYSDMVMLELYEDMKSKEYGIRMYYKTTSDATPSPLKINGCEEYCPLSKVIELTKHLVLSDWDTECKV